MIVAVLVTLYFRKWVCLLLSHIIQFLCHIPMYLLTEDVEKKRDHAGSLMLNTQTSLYRIPRAASSMKRVSKNIYFITKIMPDGH